VPAVIAMQDNTKTTTMRRPASTVRVANTKPNKVVLRVRRGPLALRESTKRLFRPRPPIGSAVIASPGNIKTTMVRRHALIATVVSIKANKVVLRVPYTRPVQVVNIKRLDLHPPRIGCVPIAALDISKI